MTDEEIMALARGFNFTPDAESAAPWTSLPISWKLHRHEIIAFARALLEKKSMPSLEQKNERPIDK